MSNESIFQLKKKFREEFPEQSQLLELAKSQDEIDELHQRFVSEARENVITHVNNSNLPDDDKQKTVTMLSSDIGDLGPYLITDELYQSLTTASGHEIENKLHALLDGLQRLSKMKNQRDKILIAYSAFTIGIIGAGITIISLIIFSFRSATELDLLLLLTNDLLVSLPLLISVVIFMIYLILIPILYFSDKPANCVVVVINELDVDVKFVTSHNTHGHMKSKTSIIPGSTFQLDGTVCHTLGFFSSVKKKEALVGTQFGMVMNTGDGTDNFFFAAENPISSMYVGNNCCCGFNKTAKEASELTNHYNKQTFAASNNNITLSIKCNSTHGSTAYYIARVYKTQK